MEQLPDGLVEWAAQAGFETLDVGDSVLVSSSPGGEIQFAIRWTLDGVVLTSRERAQPWAEEMRSRDIVAIDRYLSDVFGSGIRSRAHLPFLRVAAPGAGPAPGFRVEVGSDGWTHVLLDDGSDAGVSFSRMGPIEVAFYTYLMRFSPEEIRAAFRSPSGAPLQMTE